MANSHMGAALLSEAGQAGTLREHDSGVRSALKTLPDGRLVLTAWRGRSLKPVYHYLVRDQDHAARALGELVARATAAEAIQAKAKAKRAEEKAANQSKFKPGLILCNSWGYDQTNIDYYQVTKVSKTGATVTVRRIGKNSKPTGHMSETVSPAPGAFCGPEIKKRVTANGVQFDHGWTSPCEPGDTHNATSYH